MATDDTRTTRQILDALGIDGVDQDARVRRALRELEQRREVERAENITWDARLTAERRARRLEAWA